jgi:hypothetical protein
MVLRPQARGRTAVGPSPWPSIDLECVLFATIVFGRCSDEPPEGALP